jgi:hypothetical protein
MWTEKDREKYKDDGRRYPSDLTDVEWSIIEPLIGVTLPSLPICARCLFLPGAYGLPVASAAERLRSAPDGAHLV